MKDGGLKIHLSIVGIGSQEHQLKQYSKKMGVSSLISFLGYIPNGPELYDIYRESEIFVLPTLSEGFPRVLYEAMGQSLPIVTTSVGGIPGLMKDGVNALLIPPKSSNAIVAAVKRLSSDKELRQRLIRNGQVMVRQIVEKDVGQQIVSLLGKHFPQF